MRNLTTDSKVQKIGDLAAILAELKEQGRVVVHCHGVFDLLHPGHLAHLEAAKEQGDVLVVTITPDRFITKGHNRPAFTEALRARALAALSSVDYVAVCEHPTAVEAIRLLAPSIYAKGSEYRKAEDDLTGKIVDEAEAVEAVGGRIAFTDEVTYSSSSLINACFSTLPEETEGWMREFRNTHGPDDVLADLEALSDMDVLVVGEVIIDEYAFCHGLGKSSKDPVLAFQFENLERYAGGSLAIANHLAAFCASVTLVTLLDENEEQNVFIRDALLPNVTLKGVYQSDIPTIQKRRFVDTHTSNKVFEYYVMDDRPMGDEHEQALLALLDEGQSCDVSIVADYGHGLMTPKLIEKLCAESRFLAVNTQSNAGNRGFNTISKYRRADYVCLNGGEISLETRRRYAPWQDLVDEVVTKIDCPNFTITQGAKGLQLYAQGKEPVTAPAFSSQAKDRVGAGDAVLALTSMLTRNGVDRATIGFLGNLAGAQLASVMGNEKHLNKVHLQKQVVGLLK